ncbi:hypothetical protein [Salinarimonas chemoclinalis]|uniref:hypothetical protein n=1 Tax=Salinarimonas chemoclinalis TaxID=3241599 RepID=UPI0035577D49
MSRVRRHSPLAHAAYRDLVSSLLDEAAGDFRGDPDTLESDKDVLQARFVMQALAEDRPVDLADAYRAALARGPFWRERLGRTLERTPDLRAPLEALP